MARLSATGGAESPFTTMRAEEIFRQFFGGDFGGFSSMFGGGFGTDSQQVRLRHSVLPYPPSLVPPLLPPSLPLSLPATPDFLSSCSAGAQPHLHGGSEGLHQTSASEGAGYV